MSDQLVFDMASQTEGQASIFVKKDWLSILDNQNKSYNGSQSVIDTSQLANSNKYMNYREAYLTIPLTLCLTSNSFITATATSGFKPGLSCSNIAVGLKNWYGSVIHSFTLDYNGTTIIQQTPFCNMWNSFRLMTSLSLDDLRTQGSIIGFFPDNAGNVAQVATAFAANVMGQGTCNNANGPSVISIFDGTNALPVRDNCDPFNYNTGMLQRQLAWTLDPSTVLGSNGNQTIDPNILTQSAMAQLWDSHVFLKTNGTSTQTGILAVGILAVVYLKHLHSFFERVPLLKGVFMKLTCNFNQTSVQFTVGNTGDGADLDALSYAPRFSAAPSVVSPLGGVNPIMVAATERSNSLGAPSGGWGLLVGAGTNAVVTEALASTAVMSNAAGNGTMVFNTSLSVGQSVLSTTHGFIGTGANLMNPVGGGSVMLNVPAYTFNPVFESSYLSSPVKKIVYSDIYQYQVNNVSGAFNNLITNGIANIKSVLVLPFYTAAANGIDPILSPFDPAGCGPVSPLVQFTQFNIQVSGQNAIYNTERYAYEHFVNQFKGYGAVNGGQEDGLTSGLVGWSEWQREYSYYYVNVGRMLPVEEAVPKSVNIIGTLGSAKAINMFVFIEYGVEVSVDILTGARV
jgi:hypothetical protein